jgi:uncharacterized protein YuzE
MRISYDAEADALYIRLVEGPQQCRTLLLNDRVALNLGANEVLDAKELLQAGELPSIVLDNISAVPA